MQDLHRLKKSLMLATICVESLKEIKKDPEFKDDPRLPDALAYYQQKKLEIEMRITEIEGVKDVSVGLKTATLLGHAEKLG